MIKQYINYLKDNPEGYWFKRKLYGWGWTPATKQGWLTLAAFFILLIANIYSIQPAFRSANIIIGNFIARTIILVAALLYICWRTGEKPRWQWGLPKKSEEEYKS